MYYIHEILWQYMWNWTKIWMRDDNVDCRWMDWIWIGFYIRRWMVQTILNVSMNKNMNYNPKYNEKKKTINEFLGWIDRIVVELKWCAGESLKMIMKLNSQWMDEEYFFFFLLYYKFIRWNCSHDFFIIIIIIDH